MVSLGIVSLLLNALRTHALFSLPCARILCGLLAFLARNGFFFYLCNYYYYYYYYIYLFIFIYILFLFSYSYMFFLLDNILLTPLPLTIVYTTTTTTTLTIIIIINIIYLFIYLYISLSLSSPWTCRAYKHRCCECADEYRAQIQHRLS